jgi:hypothetical protein
VQTGVPLLFSVCPAAPGCEPRVHRVVGGICDGIGRVLAFGITAAGNNTLYVLPYLQPPTYSGGEAVVRYPPAAWQAPMNGSGGYDHGFETYVSTVPIPGAVWLFGTGLLGLFGICRHKRPA